MNVISKEKYNMLLKACKMKNITNRKNIDVYHKNNWDHFVMHWDEKNRNDKPSYIDFFFDSKTMVCYLKNFLLSKEFEECYIASSNNSMYKLKLFNDDVCKDIYSEFKLLINSTGLKINTSSAIQMNKSEFVNWCDRFSIGGFSGVSEYSVLIPKLQMLIIPHHHMNYLIYSNCKEDLIREFNNKLEKDILCVS